MRSLSQFSFLFPQNSHGFTFFPKPRTRRFYFLIEFVNLCNQFIISFIILTQNCCIISFIIQLLQHRINRPTLSQFHLYIDSLFYNCIRLFRQVSILNCRIYQIVLLAQSLQSFPQGIDLLLHLGNLIFNKSQSLTQIAVAVFAAIF